jgi:hypothetical protein
MSDTHTFLDFFFTIIVIYIKRYLLSSILNQP